MKKTKLILLLLTITVFAVALALLAGCKIGGVDYQFDYTVTFDYNVDNLGVSTNCETQYLGVKAGNKIIAPGTNDDFRTFTITNHYNKGWYTAKTDESGSPLKDESGNILFDKQWNFETDVVNSDMTLYADFHKNPTFTVKVEGGTDIVISRLPGEQYRRPTASSNKPQRDGYTFIDYYADPEFTTKFEFPYTFEEDKNGECYAFMLEGEWDIVTNATEFRRALESNHSMYIDVPSGELDLGSVYFQRGQFNKNFNGKIYGNGCVIKNIDISTAYRSNTNTYSLLGNLGANVEIRDVTFQNLTFTVTNLFAINDVDIENIQVALFANNIAEGAKFKNLKFEGCTLNYNDLTNPELNIYGYYSNAPQGAVYDCFDMSELTIQRDGQKIDLN